jgi:uncharacterized membrane protein
MLKFCNNYTADVWVCIVWYHPNCSDNGDLSGNWQKKGWWHIAPGQCKVASAEKLTNINRYWYYYAEAADGSYWAGDHGPMNVPDEAFSMCEKTASSQDRTVGLREIDVGDNQDYQINLSS